MTKVDERAYVPRVDAPLRAALARALDRPGVVAASLIGSQATGSAGPLSDIDLGVWLSPGLGSGEQVALAGDLYSAACAAAGTAEVDVVVLNRAGPLMRHRAVRDRILLVERDRDQRVRFEARAILDYLDTAPLRRTLDDGLRRRIREGRFGRR